MSNPNKAKGDRFELAVVRYLQEVFGRSAYRPHQEGYVDVGDVLVSPFALQLKDEAKHNFSGYLSDAEQQAAAAGEPYGCAVVKRRNYAVQAAYVVQSLLTFRRVTTRLRRAEELLLRANPDLFDQHMSQTKKENESP